MSRAYSLIVVAAPTNGPNRPPLDCVTLWSGEGKQPSALVHTMHFGVYAPEKRLIVGMPLRGVGWRDVTVFVF